MRIYFAVNLDGTEIASNTKPEREGNSWDCLRKNDAGFYDDYTTYLPKGTIEKIIGKGLSWNDEPIEMEVD